MTRPVTRAALRTALDRLHADVLKQGATLSADSPVRAAMLKTLDKLRRQLNEDPAWFDDVLGASRRPPGAPPQG